MKSVYIILSQTGTLFSKAIRFYTKDPYNHASISFDQDLSVMYSFGRRKRFNMLDAGFIEENFSRGLFPFFPKARCCILEIPVTDEEYEIMRGTVEQFLQKPGDYRYNLLGVLAYMAGVGLTRENYYFCSEFVSYILNMTEFWSFNPKQTRPIDFLRIPRKKLVFEGGVKEFIDLYWQRTLPEPH